MSAPSPRTIGRYALFRPLAEGGTATVYLGCLRGEGGFSRPVAIKKPHPHLAKDAELVARLLAEARIASRIRHANVVAVLDVVPDDEEPLLVFEYVHGESLSKLLRLAEEAGRPVPLPVALRLVVDVLEGLHAAHEATNERGVPLMVVHRDVSPQNVMVDAEGRARLVDFGIAKALERPFTTESGVFWGKLAYAAPEQVSGLKVDRRTDVWSAGIVLWELVAGRRCFAEAVAAEIVHRIMTEDIPPPSRVRACPAAIDEVVRRALERDPDRRWSSAREMAMAIEKVGPLADVREVASWVAKTARARLEERRRFVEEMEVDLGREARSATAAPVTVSPPRAVDPPRSPRRAPAVLAGVAALFVVTASAIAIGRASRPVPAAQTQAPPPPVASPEPTPSASASVVADVPPEPSSAKVVRAAPAARPRGPASPATKRPPKPGDPLNMDQRQ